MNTYYVYHHNDHDGIIAAGILYREMFNYAHKYGKHFEFIMIDYSVELNFDHINFKEGDRAFFLDYSFSNAHNKEEFKKLLNRREDFRDITWIDHHKTSIGLFNTVICGIVIEGVCGALLTYLFFNNYALVGYNRSEIHYNLSTDRLYKDKNIPKFIKYIDDYDCWKKVFPETNDFHYGLTISSPLDEIITTLLKDDDDTLINDIIKQGKSIQKYLDFENKEYHTNMYGFEFTLQTEDGDCRCYCLNRKGGSLMFGDKIKEYDAVIPFYFNGKNWTYSIYTEKDNVNCEAIAKSYGGGGHPKAAGWVSDNLIFN